MADPPVWLVGIVGLLVALAVQFQSPRLVGVDGYYHARYSQQILKRGLPASFPAVRYGLWSERFADKEVGFHLLLAPFTAAGTVLGAKLLIALLGGLLITLSYVVLRRFEVPWAALFALALPFASAHLLYRMQMPRAHVLSVVLFVPFLWALVRQRCWWILGLSAAFSVSYTAFQLYPLLAAAACAVVSAQARQLRIKPVLFCLAGAAAGLLIHPDFPDNLVNWYVQNIQVLTAAWRELPPGVRLGTEFQPATTREWMLGAPFLLLASWIALAHLLRSRVARDETLERLFVLASLCLGLSFLSLRFVEYAVPAGVIFLGRFVSVVHQESGDRRGRIRLIAVVGILALGAVGNTLYRVVPALNMRTIYSDKFLAGFARHVAPGDTVFTCDWQNVPVLYHARWSARYLMMLDPMFLFTHDRSRFQAWVAIRAGAFPEPGPMIRRVFDARWAVCPARHALSRQLVRGGASRVIHGHAGQLLIKVAGDSAVDTPPWEVAGPVSPRELASSQRPPRFTAAPRPGYAKDLVTRSSLLIWPPRLKRVSCFMARTRVAAPGGKGHLRVAAPGRLLIVRLGSRALPPPPGSHRFRAPGHRWEVDLPRGSVPLLLGLCVDPDETQRPYALAARIDLVKPPAAR